MLVIATPLHSVWLSVFAAELRLIVFIGLTTIVPVGAIWPTVHPPLIVTVYVNVPPAGSFGVPLIVTTLLLQLAVTPEGKPLTVAPVALVVP